MFSLTFVRDDVVVDIDSIARECQPAIINIRRSDDAKAVSDRELPYPQTLLSRLVQRIGDVLAVRRDRRVLYIAGRRQLRDLRRLKVNGPAVVAEQLVKTEAHTGDQDQHHKRERPD